MSAATGGDAACFRDVWDNLTSNWTHDQVLLGKQRLFSRRMAGKHALFSPHPPHLGVCVWALCVCVSNDACARRARTSRTDRVALVVGSVSTGNGQAV